MLQIVRSAAVDLGKHGVRVNSVSPGAVPTGVFGKAAGMDPAVADRTAGALEPAFRAVLERWPLSQALAELPQLGAALMAAAG